MLEKSFVVGVNNHLVPIEQREKLVETSLQEISQFCSSNLILLSTCNRYEIYGASTEDDCFEKSTESLNNFFKQHINNSDNIYYKTGEDMLRHGFHVASSLDSMVIGETQILSQMKKAFQNSKSIGKIDGLLERFCHSALKTGKRVRTETGISKDAVSVASVAVKQAKEVLGNLVGKKVLLVGAGEMSISAGRSLKSSGVNNFTVCSRSREGAEKLISETGAKFVAMEDLYSQIAQADLIITGTSSPDYIIESAKLEKALNCGNHNNSNNINCKLLLDVAVPRDVEPKASKLSGVRYFDVDALNEIAQQGKEKRIQQIDKAKIVIEEEVQAFLEWSESRKNVHMMQHLQAHFEEIRQEVLISHSQKNMDVEKSTRLIINKILNNPFQLLRNNSVDAKVMEHALGYLFDVGCPREKGDNSDTNNFAPDTQINNQDSSEELPVSCPFTGK